MKNIVLISAVLVGTVIGGCSDLFKYDTLGEIYDPERFPIVPTDAAFEITVDTKRLSTADSDTLLLQLIIRNLTPEHLALSTNYASSKAPAFELVITDRDKNIIWNKYKSSTLLGREFHLEAISPFDSLILSHTWNLTTNEGNSIELGNYLLFGGFFGIDQYEDTTRLESPIRHYDPVGVGKNPKTLVIE